MGRTVRFDQVYVSSLDADPIEQDVLTTVRSIVTQEIEVELVSVDKIAISNVNATKNFSLGDSLFMDADAESIVLDVNKKIRTTDILVNNRFALDAPNPTNEFQIGSNADFYIDRKNTHLVVAKGNVFSTNLFASTLIGVSNKFLVDIASSNVLKVSGNTYSTNLQVGNFLSVGNENASLDTNVALFQNGNVVISNGNLEVNGNIQVNGNVNITEAITYDTVVNLLVEDPFIQMGNTNYDSTYDNALLMTEEKDGSKANLVFGYKMSNQEFVLARTFDGPKDTVITVKEDESINLHIWGQLYTEGNVGIANTSTDYTLSVGSNVFFDDTGSNVITVHGNVYTDRLEVGPGGVKLGGRITIDEDEQIHPLTVNSNILANGIRTTGVSTSGISNSSPTDTLSIGSKIFANITAANTLTILGNTVTTNLITDSISTSSNVTVHADRYGGDSTSNVLTLKSGPTVSNVSSIEVYGASTSSTHQNIRFKTKNTERLRVASDGKIGIANTNPSEALTVSGNVHVLGSNALVLGTDKSMRVYSSSPNGTKIESKVGAGKGLNIYASQTSTMGNPKMVILENSNVGIGTTQPQGIFQTSGGTVFINSEIQKKGSFNHLGIPLVVTNVKPINGIDDEETVLLLSREASDDRQGAKASFKLGKYDDTTAGASKTRFDIYLSDDTYANETDVLTLRSDGRVGIGSTIPKAFLEVVSTGIGNARVNSLMVHNHGTTSGDAIIAAQTDTQTGNAFTSYIQSNGDLNPRGWSVGVTDGNEFRITSNVNAVSDPDKLGLYINGNTRDVGIGTNAPRGTLEVNGNVVIGNKLTFSGISGDLFGNTIFLERNYISQFNISELVLFKGGNGRSIDSSTGPDRIRQIAGEIVFQVYTDTQIGDTGLDGLLTDEPDDFPLLINSTNNGVVIIGGNSSDTNGIGDNTKLVVNGDIEFKGSGSFRLTGLSFATTEQVTIDGVITNPSVNRIRNLLTAGELRRALTFVNQTSTTSIGDDEEYARFETNGNLGIGTTDPVTAIHVYRSVTDSQDLLRLESPGKNKETGLLIYTGDGEGGYLRGFSNSVNDTTGMILGVANNATFNDCIHVTQSSNVGIGTNKPSTKFHVYDGTQRIESSTSNAIIEFKTTAGTSNIYSDTNGNVYITPSSSTPTTLINGDMEVSGDFSFGGNIDLGDAIGIGLGDETANTTLHVNGGFISNSDQVACKRYSSAFNITNGNGQDIQLIFDAHVFYAKVVAMLKVDGDVSKTSTMILEIQGGTHDGSTGSIPEIAIGTKNIFGGGGVNAKPWSSTVTVGTRAIDIRPLELDIGTDYSYDIFVEVITSAHGGLEKISNKLNDIFDNLNSTTGGNSTIVEFDY